MVAVWEQKLTTEEASKNYLIARRLLLHDLCRAVGHVLRRWEGAFATARFNSEERKGCSLALDGLRSLVQEWETEQEELAFLIHQLFPKDGQNIPVGRPPSPESLALAQAEDMMATLAVLLDRARFHNRTLEAMLHGTDRVHDDPRYELLRHGF